MANQPTAAATAAPTRMVPMSSLGMPSTSASPGLRAPAPPAAAGAGAKAAAQVLGGEQNDAEGQQHGADHQRRAHLLLHPVIEDEADDGGRGRPREQGEGQTAAVSGDRIGG